jgi:hypothetical protein
MMIPRLTCVPWKPVSRKNALDAGFADSDSP